MTIKKLLSQKTGELALTLTILSAIVLIAGMITGIKLIQYPQGLNTNAQNLKASSSNCPSSSNQSYQTLSVAPGSNAQNDPDKNLAIRGFTATTGTKGLVQYGGPPPDPKAPQLVTLLNKQSTLFTNLYQVYDWNWNTNSKGNPITDPPVTLLGIGAISGDPVFVPNSGYDIGSGYQALVLYAGSDRLTLKYTREDDITGGYTIHVEGFCTDPNLLATYQTSNNGGRSALPAVKGNQPIGTINGSEVKVAVRDTGQFLDPRSQRDWWQQGADTVISPTPGGPTSPPNGSPPPPNPTRNPPSNQSGAVTIEVHLNSANGPLWTGTSPYVYNYADPNAVIVYLTGPDQSPSGFGEQLIIPGTTSGTTCSGGRCTCRSSSGFVYECQAGSVIWKGAYNDPNQLPSGNAGTMLGQYAVRFTQTPAGLTSGNSVTGSFSQVGGNLKLALVVTQTNNSSPTPANPTPTAASSNAPSPTPPAGSASGYTNKDYEIVITQYGAEQISPLTVSAWLSLATRVPGLQTATCYPPNCDFAQ